MQVVRGQGMISQERKRDRQRQPWRPPGRPVAMGAAATWAAAVPEVRYSDGRTIALGEFEFARAEITVEAVALGVGRDAVVDAARAIAGEWLDRQEASVTGVPRADQPYPALPGARRRVGVGYGMTLRGEGKRETVKFDVFAAEPLTDGVGVGRVLDGISAWVEARAREERDAVTGAKPDEGI